MLPLLVPRVVVLCVVLGFSGPSFAQASPKVVEGLAVRVPDGDTFVLLTKDSSFAVRLHGVDAPEEGQAGGDAAAAALNTLVYGKEVRASVVETDPMGRLVADVTVGGRDIVMDLVAAGHAWHYKAFSHDPALAGAEATARSRRLGLWARANPVPPWEFRHPRPIGPEGALLFLRGNMKSKVYHGPGCQHFNCANCLSVFRSREEAERAGFRAHQACTRSR